MNSNEIVRLKEREDIFRNIKYARESHTFHYVGEQLVEGRESFGLYTCECGHTLSEATILGTLEKTILVQSKELGTNDFEVLGDLSSIWGRSK